MGSPADIIADNLAEIHDRVAEAARRGGRSPDAVTLVAVTKYATADIAELLIEAGATDLGESRPQQLWSKAERMDRPEVSWHLIGHLQRNKVRRTLPLIKLIHSGDSLSLISAIEREAAVVNRPVPLLLEVNISGDETKHGFRPTELKTALPEIARHEHIAVRGLMAMAHGQGGPDIARRDFAAVRELRDDLLRHAADDVCLDELSIGMSEDFEEAILEGATLVRIGRALFRGLDLDG